MLTQYSPDLKVYRKLAGTAISDNDLLGRSEKYSRKNCWFRAELINYLVVNIRIDINETFYVHYRMLTLKSAKEQFF